MFLKSLFNSLNHFFNKNPILSYFLVFELAFIVFFYLHSNLAFADPDSFYHAKIAMLIKEGGLVKDFPWQQFTVLKDYFIDHHFLYHVLLVPFVWLLPPLIGLKLATIIFSSALVTVFFWLLRRLKTRGAFFYTLVLLVSNPFVFRVNLAKAQALALIFFLLIILLLFEKKKIWLFIVSFLYVWLYGGWPLALILTVIFFLAELPFIIKKGKIRRNFKLKLFSDFKYFGIVAGGLILGIIVNPYFPKNLLFYWQQIFQIAVVNYRETIGVGGEWYGYNFFELVAGTSIAFLIFIVAATFFLLKIKKQNQKTIFLFINALMFFILTLRSRRNVEYFIPSMILFSAVAMDLFFKTFKTAELKRFGQEFKVFLGEKKVFFVGFLIPILLAPYIIFRDLKSVKDTYNNGMSFDKFEKSSVWLKKNSQPGSIVFQSDWDEFPLLFYHNSSNYYIVGLDPTFMYKYNQDLYWKWERVTTGKETQNIYDIIKKDFGAAYVFVGLDRHQSFDNTIKSNFLFQEVYSDDEAKIYKVL